MAEISIISARKSRLNADVKRGDSNAKTVLKLADNPSRFLSTVQIGITLIGILTGVYSGEKIAKDLEVFLQQFPSIAPYSHSISITIIVIIITFFSLVLGELVPKRIGLARPELISKILAMPMFYLSRVISPFIWLLSGTSELIVKLFNLKPSSAEQVTEEEIKAIIHEGTETGAIQEIEQDIVENVFHMGDRRIGSLMTHRNDITWLDENAVIEKNKEKIKSSIHSVFPICTGELDKMTGIVHVKDLLAAEFNNEPFEPKKYLRSPLFIPENIKAFKVLEKFKETKIHFAVVVDEFGSISGIVTMNDLLETLVGDVEEEFEKEKDIIDRADGTFLVDASVPFPDFVRYFEIDLSDEDEMNEFNTVGGLVFNLARSIPKTGSKFSWKGYSLEVIDLDGRRIDKLMVKKEER